MNGWPLVGLVSIPALFVMVVSWRAMRCNARRLRHALRTAPLEGLDLTGSTVAPVAAPRAWPDVDAVGTPAVAAAYASLADNRAVTWGVAGEGVAIVSAAVLGVLLTPPIGMSLATGASFGIAIGFGGVGLLARGHAARYWDPLAARYRARYVALTTTPAEPPPEPAPRRGLLGLFRRR